DPVVNFEVIERELAAHDSRLARLPRILALTKADLVSPEDAAEQARAWSQRLGPDVPVLATSSATGQGLADLITELLRRVPSAAAGVEASGGTEATDSEEEQLAGL